VKRNLIIIGASYLQVPLIEKANEMGYETHVFAWEEGAEGKEIAGWFYPVSILEKEKIFEIACKLEPVGIISIASDLAMNTVNYVASRLGLVCNSMKCTELTTNKYLMREVLKAVDLPCPGFSHSKGRNFPPIRNMHFPLIVKPTDRSGSRGVSRVNSEDELKKAIDHAYSESFNKDVIIEEFIDGREISVEMISWKGSHHYLACTDKVTSGPPYYVEVEQHEPAAISKDLEQKVKKITTSALSALGVENGASHTEIMITKDEKIFIIEIGARMGGDHIGAKLVYNSTGYDFVRGIIEVATGEFDSSKIVRKNGFAGIRYFSADPGNVKSIEWKDDIRIPDVIERKILVKKGDTINRLRSSSDRIAYILYKSNSGKPFNLREGVLTVEYE
jgi:biotin carboxylase